MMIAPVMTSCHSVGAFIMPSPFDTEGEDENAEGRAEQPANAAGEADPAQHRRRHGLEFVVQARNVNGRSEARREEDAPDPSQRAS